jgi:hypothetical protein
MARRPGGLLGFKLCSVAVFTVAESKQMSLSVGAGEDGRYLRPKATGTVNLN